MFQNKRTSVRLSIHENRSTILLGLLILFCLASLSSTLYLGYHFYQDTRAQRAASLETAKENASHSAQKIDRELARLQMLANRIARDLSTGSLHYEQIPNRLEDELRNYQDIFGLGVAFKRGIYEPDQLYAPYFKKNQDDEFELIQIEDIYDYTDLVLTSAAWYREAIASNGLWLEPYFGQASQEWLVEYNVPFFQPVQNLEGQEERQSPVGIVYVNHSLKTLNQLLESVDTGEEGFSYLLTNEGNYISHPDPDYVQQSIIDKASELNSSLLNSIREGVLNREEFYVEGIDPITGGSTWTFHHQIARADWSVGVVFDKSVGQSDPNNLLRQFIWVMLLGNLFVLTLVALLLQIDHPSLARLWTMSILVSILFTGAMVILWYLSIHYTPRDTSQNVLTNQLDVDEHLTQVNLAFERDDLQPPIQIPTGIMVETIGFANSNENLVSGYLWQKYPLDLPDDIERGFLFTDAVDPFAGQVKELYRVQEDGYEMIVWFFRATLRQEPSVEKYPLDEATVQIQIWPKSLSPRIILVPDLDGYELTIPSKTPGIVDVIVLENWQLDRSFYSYDDYNANFGSRKQIRKHNVPDLYFNVIIRRAIISPLVANAITMVIVAALAFGVLLVQVDGSFTVLGYGASLFFVVAISHIGLRDELEIPGVVYLEYGYILLYLTILSISLNSILYYSKIHPHSSTLSSPASPTAKTERNVSSWIYEFVRYKDNLWPKLLYWPLITGFFLAITTA